MAGQADGARPETLTSRTIAGLRWTMLSTLVGLALQLVYTAVINRLIDPTAAGLFTVATLAVRFSNHFAAMGVQQALVQKPELDDEDIRAAFASSLVTGFGFFVLVWLLAPVVADFAQEPAVTPVLRAAGATLVFKGLAMTPDGLIRRRMQFKALATRTIVAYVVGYLVVGIGSALLGFGVWSLVAALVTESAVSWVLTYTAVRHSLRPSFALDRLRTLYAFGSRVSLTSLMEWAGTNLDTLAVTRYTTAALLGQYGRAYYLASLPIAQATRSLSNVLFPGLSRIQTDTDRLRRVYLSSVAVAAFALLPVCAGMAAAAPELVLVAIGPQWDIAAQILPILVGAVAVNALSHFAGVLVTARAELNRKILLQGVFLVAFTAFLALARGRDLWAYAAALMAGEVIRHALYMLLLRQIIDMPVGRVLRAYVPGMLTAAVVAGLITAGRAGMLELGAPAPAVLAVDIALGALGMLVMLRFGPAGVVRRTLHERLATIGFSDRGRLPRYIIAVTLGRQG